MEQDATIYKLFTSSDKISIEEINAVVDKTIKACLLMLLGKGGFIHSGDFRESGKKRKVSAVDGYLVAHKEIIVKDADANNK